MLKDYTNELFAIEDGFKCHYPAAPLSKKMAEGVRMDIGMYVGCRYPLFVMLDKVGHYSGGNVKPIEGLFQCAGCGTLYYKDEHDVLYINLSDRWRKLDDIKSKVLMDIDDVNIVTEDVPTPYYEKRRTSSDKYKTVTMEDLNI